ncbi:MAG: hypothetical protein IJC88_02625 [Oscillospiraceae bacterium]|nr:hypothetical protein [Oscillospiraceae bacterium]
MSRGYRSGNHIVRRISITLAVLCVLAGILLAIILPNISINDANLKVLRIPFTDQFILLENAPFNDPSQVEAKPADTEEPVRPVEGTTYQERIERAVFLPYHLMFDPAAVDAFLASIGGQEVNTVVIEVKSPSGALAFASQNPLSEGASAESNEPLLALKTKLNEAGYAVVASFSCFRDNALSKSHEEFGLKNQDGALWGDSMRYAWLDPYSEDVQVYLLSLLSELYDLGFHEILLQNLSFPIGTDTNLILYDEGKDTEAEKQTRIDQFLFQLGSFAADRAELSLSVRFDAAEGQSMQSFANSFYRIYLPLSSGESGGIDHTPITEFSALLGEGTLPYRFVALISLSERTSNEAFAMKAETADYGIGYYFESQDGGYDPLLFQTNE